MQTYPTRLSPLALASSQVSTHKRNSQTVNVLFALSSVFPYPRYQSLTHEFISTYNLGTALKSILDKLTTEFVYLERMLHLASLLIQSTSTNINIQIRPHPYSDIEKIKEIIKCYGLNVQLLSTSEPIWYQLLSSDLLVHGGSTSSLEVEALGIPSFSLDDHPTLSFDFINSNINFKEFLPLLEALRSRLNRLCDYSYSESGLINHPSDLIKEFDPKLD